MSEERLAHLESRYSWLERHVLEQDKAMAEMGEELRRLRRELATLRALARPAPAPGEPREEPEAPPPHY